MKLVALSLLLQFALVGYAQSPCEKVKLYDEMMVQTERPILVKLKPVPTTQVPKAALDKMKSQIIEHTSEDIYKSLKIKAVRVYDSVVAAGLHSQGSIYYQNGKPVSFFYTIVFETLVNNKTKLVFRVDITKDGDLLDVGQIGFATSGTIQLISCEEAVKIAATDTTQQIKDIWMISLVFAVEKQMLTWSIFAAPDSKTGIQYMKEIHAGTGQIMFRSVLETKQVAPGKN